METIQDQTRGCLQITVEILHPINHDGRLYSRGVHDLDAALAMEFLKLRDPVSLEPIVQLLKKEKAPPKGSVTLDQSHGAYRQRTE